MPHRIGRRGTHLPLSLLLRSPPYRLLHLGIGACFIDHRNNVEDNRLVLHILRLVNPASHHIVGHSAALVLVSVAD